LLQGFVTVAIEGGWSAHFRPMEQTASMLKTKEHPVSRLLAIKRLLKAHPIVIDDIM
jgi:hypothetical protein